MILLDEPCSALDPISTARIEELIDELKDDYTIAIVTHNMQQAARVSEFTAFMYLGRAGRIRRDHQHLHHANDRKPRITSPAALASRMWKWKDATMTEQTAKAFDGDFEDLARMVAEMGGLAENGDALAKRVTRCPSALVSALCAPVRSTGEESTGDLFFGEAAHFSDHAGKVLQVGVEGLGGVVGHRSLSLAILSHSESSASQSGR